MAVIENGFSFSKLISPSELVICAFRFLEIMKARMIGDRKIRSDRTEIKAVKIGNDLDFRLIKNNNR